MARLDEAIWYDRLSSYDYSFSVATLRNFDELGDKSNDIAVLREFVNSHFNPPGSELVEWFPRDWVDFPSTFLNIHDYHHRRWALHLHRIWRDLCRRVSDSSGVLALFEYFLGFLLHFYLIFSSLIVESLFLLLYGYRSSINPPWEIVQGICNRN